MDAGELLEDAGVLFTRLIVVAAALLGFYLLLEGTSLLQRLLGAVLVSVGLFLIYHHSVVISRGSLGVHDE